MTNEYKEQIGEIIETLKLENDTDISILKHRFLGEVVNYETRRNDVKKYYNAFRFIVTTGSILLPALLSIGQMDPAKLPKHFDSISYWVAWTISLLVTASNGFLQLFSLDKNYLEFAITTEQLKTEGWQFFQLSGKYEDYETHQQAYKSFNKSIENIKRKQVEKEFSGKGDVNKNKKEKSFDFQKELSRQLPDKYERDVEQGVNKVNEISSLMSDKMNKLDGLVKLLENKNVGENTVKELVEKEATEVNEIVEKGASENITDNLKKTMKEGDIEIIK
jgi:hypothetical protein